MGGVFSRGGRGEFGAWSVSPSAVPRVSEEASRSAFRLREPCAGPNVCGMQCDRDRGVVRVPPFFLLNLVLGLLKKTWCLARSIDTTTSNPVIPTKIARSGLFPRNTLGGWLSWVF